MKIKVFLLFILALTLSLLICSCGEKPPQLFVVNFEENTNESSVQNLAIESGKTCSKPEDPVKEGYEFLGWYNGETLWNFETDTVTSDITLSAKWKRITYTVTFNSDGGSDVVKQTINYGDIASKPQDPTKLDCEFLGWYNGETLWNFDEEKIYSDITLTARWKNCAIYTVTFDSDGGSPVNKQHVMHGEKATEPVSPTKTNKRFLGWYNGETPWNFTTDAITSDIVLKAKWEPSATFTVTFNSDGGSAVGTQHIAVGDKASEPTPPTKENHAFLGWYDGETPWNFATDTVTENVTLTAKWKNTTTYTVSFSTDGGTSVANQYIVHGGKISEPVTEKENHILLGWYDGETLWDFNTDTVTKNVNLTARWKNYTLYTVTFDSDGGTEFNEQNVRHGNKANAPGTPAREDSRFIGWYYGETLWDFNTDTVTSNIILKAKYEYAPTYTVTFITYTEPEIIVYYVYQGEKIVAPVLPDKFSHIFDAWYIQGTTTVWDFNVAPTQDLTLEANWEFALPPHEW